MLPTFASTLKQLLFEPIDEITEYDVGDYDRDEGQPNCTIAPSEFVRMCTGINHFKNKHVTISGYDRGMLVRPGGVVGAGTCYRFGNVGADDEIMSKIGSNGPTFRILDKDVIGRFNIPNSIIKRIAKLSGLSGSNIKVYIENDKSIKLMCWLGYFGVIRVYLQGLSDDDISRL